MNRLPQQAAAQFAAAALALMVTLGTLLTLDSLAQSPAAKLDAGTLVQAQPGAARG